MGQKAERRFGYLLDVDGAIRWLGTTGSLE
jgi:hypothetical protein